MAFIFSMNTDMKKVVECLSEFGKGNFDAPIEQFSGKKAVINIAIEQLRQNMKALISDATMLSKAAVEGKLATRADATKHQGDFRKIVQGVNETLDAVIRPLNVAADYVDKISRGDIPPSITDSYNGDFNQIKVNLNNCIGAIEEQANAARRIGLGDLSVKVNVRSEKDILSKGLVEVISVLQGLQKEFQRLTDASRGGQLSERGKSDQFQGAYAEVIGGVNEMLNAILLPIGEGNRVLRQIRGGDLREKVEIECSGDHKKMKDAVNGVHAWLTNLVAFITKIANGDLTAEVAKASEKDQIHEWLMLVKNNIGALVADATMLSKAAVEGKLATRADVSKHQGDFQRIVQGVNETLDAVIIPLNVAAEYVDRISKGDIPKIISGNYNGDFNLIKNNLNFLIEATNSIIENAKKVSQGNLMVELKKRGDNDGLMESLASMVNSLREITSEIVEGVNVIASSSSEIMASTNQVASGATETAAAVSETTSTVEEVKQTAQVSSQKARNVADAAQKAVQAAQTGRRSVDESIAGMGRIQGQVVAIADSIVRLSDQSQTIGEIIATVNDLAEQSNLLAVNAAIEAAKAGEQGKGFGVVAQEVKSLAEQSKEATSQVRAILNDIQKATNAAVLATEQGNKAVEAGVRQSQEAGEAIRQMGESIDESAQAALMISASSQQQLTGMDQVALAMDNIKQASEQNVTGMRQVEQTVQGLHDLGQKLKGLVARYKV